MSLGHDPVNDDAYVIEPSAAVTTLINNSSDDKTSGTGAVIRISDLSTERQELLSRKGTIAFASKMEHELGHLVRSRTRGSQRLTVALIGSSNTPEGIDKCLVLVHPSAPVRPSTPTR